MGQKLLRFVRSVFTGVCFPELVFCTAWFQWHCARQLGAIIKKELKLNPYKQKVDEWTTTHSHFATSGGFVFDIDDQILNIQEREAIEFFLPQDCPRRITITASGIAFLAHCGHLPNISKAEINDKSKASSIAKALVIVQVSWMFIQVLGRLQSRLPVTLLELNTLAHV